jgi:hypothetical protein
MESQTSLKQDAASSPLRKVFYFQNAPPTVRLQSNASHSFSAAAIWISGKMAGHREGRSDCIILKKSS